jgi:hypothetical protein
MSFEPASLFLSLVAGTVGLALLVYGRKQMRIPHIVAGLLLMIYPYFMASVWSLIGVGILLGAGLWLAVRLGW